MSAYPQTPMETHYPTICAWTRHQTVNTDKLRAELVAALSWVSEGDRRCSAGEHVEPHVGCVLR